MSKPTLEEIVADVIPELAGSHPKEVEHRRKVAVQQICGYFAGVVLNPKLLDDLVITQATRRDWPTIQERILAAIREAK